MTSKVALFSQFPSAAVEVRITNMNFIALESLVDTLTPPARTAISAKLQVKLAFSGGKSWSFMIHRSEHWAESCSSLGFTVASYEVAEISGTARAEWEESDVETYLLYRLKDHGEADKVEQALKEGFGS